MAGEAIITKPYKIEHHPNADKLDILVLNGEGGFCCVVGRDQFTLSDLVLYIEPDSVIPDAMVEKLQTTAKIKISNRIRAIKLRGLISEGLCLVPSTWLPEDKIQEGADVSDFLEIKHYEPPPPKGQGWKSSKGSNPWYKNKGFREYTHIDRFEKVCRCFEEGKNVHISTKFHGMNARYGWCHKKPKNWWQKLLQLVGLMPKSEYLVGSHRTVRNIGKKGSPLPEEMGDKDFFILAGKKYNLKEMAQWLSKAYGGVNVVVYAELIGWGLSTPLQKGYWYGIPEGEVELRVFDILIDGRYFDMSEVFRHCAAWQVPTVDTLYEGPFSLKLLDLAQTVDERDNWKGNREGIVIKPQPPRHDQRMGYVIAKKINPDYLLDKTNSDFH
jgi:RNA ligase (TIGR02306 family)